jgi:trans-2,3-dihydro-3-hydroxyanthranilate isomerase
MNKALYYLLDVFTKESFGGNQLAIFPDDRNISESLKPRIARELNLSETVFLSPTVQDLPIPMRIFTPGGEVPTAGHPTVGTAYYLSRELAHDYETPLEITFQQKIGPIKAEVFFENNLPYKAVMYQPLPKFGVEYQNRGDFAKLLSLEEQDLLHYPVQWVSCGLPYVIIPVVSLEKVKAIQFRLDIWQTLRKQVDQAFIYAFTPYGETKEGDLHGRMFAPDIGVFEDAATGSANGPLGCYVTHHKIKESPFLSEQGFEMGRRSLINIEIQEDDEKNIHQVKVGGSCVFMGKGEIFL